MNWILLILSIAAVGWGYRQGNYFWIGSGIALFALSIAALANQNEQEQDDHTE